MNFSSYQVLGRHYVNASAAAGRVKPLFPSSAAASAAPMDLPDDSASASSSSPVLIPDYSLFNRYHLAIDNSVSSDIEIADGWTSRVSCPVCDAVVFVEDRATEEDLDTPDQSGSDVSDSDSDFVPP